MESNMILQEVTVKDIEKGLQVYLNNWKENPGKYDVVTQETDPKQYAKAVAPLFFHILKKIKESSKVSKQATIEFFQVFYDLQIDLRFLLVCIEPVGDGYLINQVHMNNLRRSSVKLDKLLGVAPANADSPHPLTQKNKSMSNHP